MSQKKVKKSFKLDDFYILIDDENKIFDVNNILKKAKENSDIYNTSFIYYINCYSKFINNLFNSINSSKESIIS